MAAALAAVEATAAAGGVALWADIYAREEAGRCASRRVLLPAAATAAAAAAAIAAAAAWVALALWRRRAGA